MPNYQNSKIYKIWSPSCTEIYIGATTQPLSQRFHRHKKKYEIFINGKIKYLTKSREILKYGDAKIELVKKCPCNDKEELNKIEAEFIRNTGNCVNLKIPGRNGKQYYEEFKNELLEKGKIYREENKQKISEQRKIYYEENKQKKLEQNKNYYEKNKQKISEQRKIYYKENKQKKLEQKKQKINCVCGSIYRKIDKARHERSKKHINFILESES